MIPVFMPKSTILIVDDVEANRETLEDLLDDPNLELNYVADGPAALVKAAEIRPDLILLDVMMPGMDGFEVCTRLRATPVINEVPIIMLTSLDDRESRLRGIESGADDFLSKPYDRIELRSRIRGILRLNRFRLLQQASERVREQAELIDLAPDAILVCDLQQRITHWNPAAERLYGWSASEAIGQCANILLARGEDEETSMAELPSGDEWRGEITQVTRDENDIIVDCRRKLLRDASGRPKAFLSINTDLTEKKQIEEQILRAQRLESIGALASGIAHDLNNALGPSLMSIELLRDRLVEESDVSLLDMLEESTQRGARLVKQILGFARGGHEKKNRRANAAPRRRNTPHDKANISPEHRDQSRMPRRNLASFRECHPDRSDFDESQRQCARCHARGRQTHHLAPECIFKRIRLCRWSDYAPRCFRPSHRFRYWHRDARRSARENF